ncbi:MAG: hypothetical protein N3G20_09880, partial [Verrucomicrobiae bacterium]|nr:hypothetical protein [Verrucomicrobiae bacterium]
ENFVLVCLPSKSHVISLGGPVVRLEESTTGQIDKNRCSGAARTKANTDTTCCRAWGEAIGGTAAAYSA